MIRYGPSAERAAVAGLLLLCGACCLLIAWSTVRLEQANERRRAQLRLLDDLTACSLQLREGPIPSLDGLFDVSIGVVRSDSGSRLTFCGGSAGAVR